VYCIAYLMPRSHDRANIEQTSSKRRANIEQSSSKYEAGIKHSLHKTII